MNECEPSRNLTRKRATVELVFYTLRAHVCVVLVCIENRKDEASCDSDHPHQRFKAKGENHIALVNESSCPKKNEEQEYILSKV